MGAQALLFILLLALLIHQTEAGCVYSWDSADWDFLGPCDSCSGSCDSYNFCSCSDGINACLPNVNVSCIDPALCCPPGLYYSSAESCCTDIPTCSTPCATDEACDVAACVCNATNYQHETLADFHPMETCDVDAMTVTISQCQLSSLGFDPASSHLINSSADCMTLIPAIGSTQRLFTLQAKKTPGWCGNTVTELGSRLYVANSVTINTQNNTNITGGPISFPITCPILSGVNPLAQTLVISGVNGIGLYPLTMAVYKDPGFGNLYESNEIILGPKIYVALYIYYTDADHVLRLQDCVASPTSERNDTEALHLISEGCATDDVTRIIQNGNTTEVRMEISYSKFRDFSTLRLFCDVRLCVKNTDECTMCMSSILSSMEVTELQLDLKIKGTSGNITFNETGTTHVTLSWGGLTDITDATYDIVYWDTSSAFNVTSNSTNVTLQNLTSGTEYTIAVKKVGTESEAFTGYVFTRPMEVKQLWTGLSSSDSISLFWTKPDEYQSSYSYRVQTNVTSPSTPINNLIVINESAIIVNLTAGETYTFLVYTRAADNITESDPVSLTTCTVPGQAVNVTAKNYNLADSLVVSWTAPEGKASYYNVTITGDVNRTLQNPSTEVAFNELLPGREYTVTVQTVSGSCSSAVSTVTEATNPSPPSSITFNTVSESNTTISWGEPVNMTGVIKSYNIIYWNSSSSTNWTETNITSNVTLHNLTSGTDYTIAVRTVGVRGYQSTSVTGSLHTRPIPVKDLWNNLSTVDSIFLTWTKPDEYQSSYNYRVQTNVTSSSTPIHDTIVTNESAKIMNLTAGETYTFLVYTRAANNVTESDPVSLTTCTLPGQADSIAINSYKSVNSLVVNWTAPTGKVSSYNVTITGDVNNTILTNTTQVDFTGLSPGREYNVTVQTISGNCSNTSPPVTEATYPTPPQNLIFNIISTDSVTASWENPKNMSGLTTSYHISWNSSSASGTVTRNAPNVTLQNLSPGTSYTLTLVTEGVRGYQSTPVTGWIFTSPLEQSGSVQIVRSASGDAMNVTFQGFDTSNGPIVAYAIIMTTDLSGNKPPEGVLAKTYNDFKSGSTKAYVTTIIEQKNSQGTVRLNEISAQVGDGSKTHNYINGPLDPQLQYRVSVAGFAKINYDPTNGTINEDQSTATITSYSGSPSANSTTTAAAATSATSTANTRHVQRICGFSLVHLQLIAFLLCIFSFFG